MSQTERPGADSAHDPGAVDRSLLHGIAWTGGVRWAIQLVSWAATLVVARLLSPGDYGLMGMATVYLGFVQLISDFGLASAIVQRRDLTPEKIARLGGFSVALGLGFLGISTLLAAPIAAFYGQPPVAPLIVALSASFVISSTAVVPRALLYRELAFKRLAWLEAVEAVTLTSCTLLLAILGFGYWALAIGALAGKLASAVTANLWRPHRLAPPLPFRTIASEVRFGSNVAASQVSWYLYENADFAIVGRLLGKAALGAYTLGWTIATIPVEKISALLQRVTFSVFASVQHDKPALRRYLSGLSEGLALVTFPTSIGMALVADRFVLVVLGPQWEAAITPMRVLCCYAGLRASTTLFSQILITGGQARRELSFNLVALVVLPLLFLVGSRWGTAGVAMGWLVGYPLIQVPLFIRAALRHIEMRPGEYLRALWPAVSGTLVMAAVVLTVRFGLGPRLSMPASLVLEVAAGAAAFLVVTLTMHGARVRAYVTLLRSLRN